FPIFLFYFLLSFSLLYLHLNSFPTRRSSDLASVLHSYQQVAEKYFGNPSSIHQLGAEVDQLQMKAREQAAELLNIQPSEVDLPLDRKSTRLNSSHVSISYAVFCLKKTNIYKH